MSAEESQPHSRTTVVGFGIDGPTLQVEPIAFPEQTLPLQTAAGGPGNDAGGPRIASTVNVDAQLIENVVDDVTVTEPEGFVTCA